MEDARRLATLVLVAIVAVACGSATPTATPTPTLPASIAPTASPMPTPSSVATVSAPTASPATGVVPGADIELARVVDVIDGDTIRVRLSGEEYRVRYIGIDAPERGDPYSGASTRANSRLVAGERVWLERDVSETDRYDRLLRHVWLRRGDEWLNVNAEIVRRGLAYASSYPPDTMYDHVYEAAQDEAQAARVGLWSGSD